jgi:hypothetical protein
MLSIQDSRVLFKEGAYVGKCNCGKVLQFSTKASCIRMLDRGSCRNCKRDYRNVDDSVKIYTNKDNKWCSCCSGCGEEQSYTRKDHAKQSDLGDWQCKKCVGKAKGYSNNLYVGNEQRNYNKFRKSANNRKILWDLNLKEFLFSFNKKCSLTNWDISMDYNNNTASLDRIDSSKGYTKDNIQWVHTMVNMSKNKYDNNKFIEMCKLVAINN